MPGAQPPQYAIVSVDRALQVLLMLEEEAVRVSDVAERLGVAPSTAHRLLSMLVFRGFAVQDESRTYRAGPALHQGPSERTASELVAVVRPHLQALSNRHDETVHLMTRRGTAVSFLESVEGQQALRVGSRAGAVMPAHLCSGGRAMLAELSLETLAELYGSEPTEDVPDVRRLHRLLVASARRGYALNFGDTERGIHAIGVTIHDAGARGEAAISLSVPSLRLPRNRAAEVAESVRATATAIDAELAQR